MSAKSKTQWDAVALALAKEAHEENFASRRGTIGGEEFGHEGVFCYYNNNPWGGADGRQWREKENAELRQWMKEQQITELAYAPYPSTGEEAGYSFAMIIEGDAQTEERFRAKLHEVLGKVMEEMKAADATAA